MKNCTAGVIAALFFIVVMSCSSENSNVTPPAQKYTITTEQYTFHADQEKYQDINIRRGEGGLCAVEWKVRNVSRAGNTLTLDISRPKDCEIRYEIIWNGAIMESYPMMANIFINAISENCSDQDDTHTDTLVINLEEAFPDIDATTLDEIVFFIKEVCSLTDIQCTADCDVAVSN